MKSVKVGVYFFFGIAFIIFIWGILYFIHNLSHPKSVELTVNDLTKSASKYDVTYSDTALWLLAERFHSVPKKEVDSYTQELKKVNDNTFNSLSKEDLNEQVKRVLLMEKVYLDLAGISEKDIQKQVKDGTHIYQILQIIITDTENANKIAKEVEKELKNAKENDQISQAVNKLLNRDDLDVLVDYYTEHDIIKGFEAILEAKEGDVITFGDDRYKSIVSVLRIVDADVKWLKQVYSVKESKKYANNKQLLQKYIEYLDKDYKLPKDVEELLDKETKPYLDFIKQQKDRKKTNKN